MQTGTFNFQTKNISVLKHVLVEQGRRQDVTAGGPKIPGGGHF